MRPKARALPYFAKDIYAPIKIAADIHFARKILTAHSQNLNYNLNYNATVKPNRPHFVTTCPAKSTLRLYRIVRLFCSTPRPRATHQPPRALHITTTPTPHPHRTTAFSRPIPCPFTPPHLPQVCNKVCNLKNKKPGNRYIPTIPGLFGGDCWIYQKYFQKILSIFVKFWKILIIFSFIFSSLFLHAFLCDYNLSMEKVWKLLNESRLKSILRY